MFSTKIGDEYRYDMKEAKFITAFTFLHRNDLALLPEGWIELENGIKASIQHYSTFEWDENEFETHDAYFDVQFVVEGYEYVGVCPRESLSVSKPYNKDNEITFYHDPSESGKVLLGPGTFIVLGPDDAHKPRCIAGKRMFVKKVVVKVPVK